VGPSLTDATRDGSESKRAWHYLDVPIVLMSRLRLLFLPIAVVEAESINLVFHATGVGCGLVIAAGVMIYQVG
jgi:hypothetical protein